MQDVFSTRRVSLSSTQRNTVKMFWKKENHLEFNAHSMTCPSFIIFIAGRRKKSCKVFWIPLWNSSSAWKGHWKSFEHVMTASGDALFIVLRQHSCGHPSSSVIIRTFSLLDFLYLKYVHLLSLSVWLLILVRSTVLFLLCVWFSDRFCGKKDRLKTERLYLFSWNQEKQSILSILFLRFHVSLRETSDEDGLETTTSCSIYKG